MSKSASEAAITLSADAEELHCAGCWTIHHIRNLRDQWKKISHSAKSGMQLIATQIEQMDSAGALILHDIITELNQLHKNISTAALQPTHRKMLELVATEAKKCQNKAQSTATPQHHTLLHTIGFETIDKIKHLLTFFTFLGEMIMSLLQFVRHPKRLHWPSVFAAIDDTGFRALPIIALMSFLIGVVLAYQLGTELRNYGANIYIVDFTGIAILREFGPLITAIVLAGRTSTSFSALIGTMVVNEEIDALRTMGIVPIERLVWPRIFGLLIAMPLLVVWADVFGVLGGMFMADHMMNISYLSFLERFQQAVALRQFTIGLIKTPVFALIIAGIGCFQGFQVGNSAESVGRQTTKAAVQAIFLIIAADAIFSVVFNSAGW